MKISNWILGLWHERKLKGQQSSPFKMKVETDTIQSNCILEILNEVESSWYSITSLVYKLGVKSIQNKRSKTYRDEFDKQSVLPDPVFSENQIAEMKIKHRLYRSLIIGFTIAESFLYYLTASLFVPGGAMYMKLSVAVFLALLIMFALNYAFEKHFLYREAVVRENKKELTELQLNKYIDTRNIGYAIIVLCFAAIIFSGLARIFYLENIPGNGLSAAKFQSIQSASKMASVFTLLVTIIAAIFMAVVKQEQSKIGVKYHTYKAWHTAHVRRNKYTQDLIKAAHRLVYATEQGIEKYWQLIADIKRLFRMETEYDVKYETLHEEYVRLKSKPGFVVNNDIYRKFSSIQCVYEELFRFGVLNNNSIKDKINFAKKVLSIPEEHLAEHLREVVENAHKPLLTTASQNGISKNHIVTTN